MFFLHSTYLNFDGGSDNNCDIKSSVASVSFATSVDDAQQSREKRRKQAGGP